MQIDSVTSQLCLEGPCKSSNALRLNAIIRGQVMRTITENEKKKNLVGDNKELQGAPESSLRAITEFLQLSQEVKPLSTQAMPVPFLIFLIHHERCLNSHPNRRPRILSRYNRHSRRNAR